jgi:lipoprotein-releasing system ATP-binding protein
MNNAELRLEDIEKHFFHAGVRTEILNKTTLSFEQGVSYALIGASGVGKSTVMHILSGLEQPSAGKVLFNNQDIAAFTTQEKSLFLNQSIGLVFQQPYLIRELCVLENVMLPGLLRGSTSTVCYDRAQQLLHEVDLHTKAMSKVSTLSGGQQQRVALARALLNKPQFLLADEPTGSLDSQTGKLIVELLSQFQREYGMGIIVCTHDMHVASAMNQIYQLRGGTLEVRNIR